MLSHIKKLSLIALAMLAVATLVVAACSGDDDDDDSGGDTAALQEQLTKTQVLAALTAFRNEGLHNFDEAAQEASEIDPAWAGKVTRVRRAVVSVSWPDELAGKAAAFETALMDLETALDGGDLSEVKGAVSAMHGAWHELDGDAYAHISGEEAGDHAE